MSGQSGASRPGGEFLQYGGQAVIEGVMMRSPRYFAVACRRPDGQIIVQREEVDKSFIGKLKWLNKPFLRGTLALLDAMILGTRALTFASNVQLVAEQERLAAEKHLKAPPEPSAKEVAAVEIKAAAASTASATPEVAGSRMPASGRINDIAIGGAVILSLIMGFLIFRATPTLLTEFFQRMGWLGKAPGRILLNAMDGLIRLTLFFAYISAISLLEGVRAVFQYHGAEHKAINTLEANRALTIANAQEASRIHPRCGTSFIFVVLMIDLLVVLFLPRPVWYLRLLLHLAVLPPVAGISYEVIKLAGQYRKNPLVMAVFAPGMWTQFLSTREPKPDQVEVALAALTSVLEAEGYSDPVHAASGPPHAPDPTEPVVVTA